MTDAHTQPILGITLALSLLAVTGCKHPTGGPGGGAAGPAPTVVVETVEKRDVPVVAELVARTEAVNTVELRANVEGRLMKMSFREGFPVEKGQLLFEIDPRRFDAAVDAAQATVAKAEADLELAREQQHLVNARSALRQAEASLLRANQDLERMKPLAARKAVPVRDLDAAVAAQSSAAAAVEDARATVRTTEVTDRMGLKQAEANVTAARAALEKARLDREETSIHAPIAGLIGRMEISVGNYVGRGEASRLATISQLDPIRVIFRVPEALYLRTTVDNVDRSALDRFELVLSDNSVYPHRGKFNSLGRTVDEKTGTLEVETRFPNPRGALLPGMFGRIRMAIERRPGAVLVSERALFDVQGSKAVYIVDQGRVALRSVATEGRYENKSIITHGLAGGEQVITEGVIKVRPGQPVQVRKDR